MEKSVMVREAAALEPQKLSDAARDFLRRLGNLINAEDVFGYGMDGQPDADLEWDGVSNEATLRLASDGVPPLEVKIRVS